MSKRKGHCVIITNSKGKYLMQFRDNTPNIDFPLMWEFFGGSSEGDETVIEATIRELKEELDIDVMPEELEIVDESEMHGVDEYLVRYKKPLEWNDFTVLEGAGCAFLTKEELLQLESAKRVKIYVNSYM